MDRKWAVSVCLAVAGLGITMIQQAPDGLVVFGYSVTPEQLERAGTVGLFGGIATALLSFTPFAFTPLRNAIQRLRRADTALIVFHPDTGRRGDPIIGVENIGCDGQFAATGEILDVQNDPNPVRAVAFKVCWLESDDGRMMIPRGQTRHLRLGHYYIEHEANSHGYGRLHRLDLLRMEPGACQPWEWFRWFDLDGDEEIPRIRCRITVSKLTEDDPPNTQEFVVRTRRYGGASVEEAGDREEV